MPKKIRRSTTGNPPSTKTASAPSTDAAAERPSIAWLSPRHLNLVLVGLALLYAFLAAFHTILDFDMGWHLATARYVLQHHVVPRTDVLSYTSQGQPWMYPPFAGVLLYGIFSACGYAGLTWFCALASLAVVAILLPSPRRPAAGVAAALAIVAVPRLAQRAHPRADIFSLLLFSISFVLLWQFHRKGIEGSGNAAGGNRLSIILSSARPLWVLPLLMLFWVNLHPGFVAGLGVLVAYLICELFELPFSDRREAAIQRLRRAAAPLAATVLVTVMNPFGIRIYDTALRLAGLQASTHAVAGPVIAELQPVRISFANLPLATEWRVAYVSSYWWLVFIAVAVFGLAAWRRRWGAPALLAGAFYLSTHYERYTAFFAVIVVVLGSSILAEAFSSTTASHRSGSSRAFRIPNSLLTLAACAVCLLACVRIFDVVTNRYNIVARTEWYFGTGRSSWVPERAAAFIREAHLPGNVFHDYNSGGFVAWRLGPEYKDFLDGRLVSTEAWAEQNRLLSLPPDSPEWDQASAAKGINVLFYSLDRLYGSDVDLMSLCQSHAWQPVYMDEVSIVLLRQRPENQPWLDKYKTDCHSQKLVPPSHVSSAELATFYGNAGHVLQRLDRNDEALQFLLRDAELAPLDADAHLGLADLYEHDKNLSAAESHLQIARSVLPNQDTVLYTLGAFYVRQQRFEDARPVLERAIELSSDPTNEYILLALAELNLQQPQRALDLLSRSEERLAQSRPGQEDAEVQAEIAEGRASAYMALGDTARAIEFQQEATRRTPLSLDRWQALAAFSNNAGNVAVAEQAEARVHALSGQK